MRRQAKPSMTSTKRSPSAWRPSNVQSWYLSACAICPTRCRRRSARRSLQSPRPVRSSRSLTWHDSWPSRSQRLATDLRRLKSALMGYGNLTCSVPRVSEFRTTKAVTRHKWVERIYYWISLCKLARDFQLRLVLCEWKLWVVDVVTQTFQE